MSTSLIMRHDHTFVYSIFHVYATVERVQAMKTNRIETVLKPFELDKNTNFLYYRVVSEAVASKHYVLISYHGRMM